MGAMRGKLVEMVAFTTLLQKQVAGSATIYYNGQSATTNAGYGIDTQGYSDCEFLVSIGAQCAGPFLTIQHTILGSATDNPMAATAISGSVMGGSLAGISIPATFNLNNTNSNTLFEGSVQAKDQFRYLFLKSDFQGSLITVDYCAIAVLGNDNHQAPAKVLQFDL